MTVLPAVPKPGRCRSIGSSSPSFPSSASRTTAAAVNCLVSDAIRKIVSRSTSVRHSTFASPRVASKTRRPFSSIPTETPGPAESTNLSSQSSNSDVIAGRP